jgi:hypothetical protein
MSERDIIEKLRAPAYWMSGSNEGHEGENDVPRQAADEIDRLREQDEAIRAEFDQLSFFLSEWRTEAARLAAENERLRAALSWIIKTYPANNARLIHNEQQIISIATKALQDKSDE